MTTARSRTSAVARPAARPASVRKNKTAATPRQVPQGETMADAAIVLRKAIGHQIKAFTGTATQRISQVRALVARRANEARQVLDRSVQHVEARVQQVVKTVETQTVRKPQAVKAVAVAAKRTRKASRPAARA